MPDTLPHLSKVSNKKLALKTLRAYFTPFLSILLSNLGKGYQLSFQAEIKGQTGKNYETQRQVQLICNVIQTGQATTWKETWIEFKNCKELMFWASIKKVYWDFHYIRIVSLYKKKSIVKSAQWPSLIVPTCIVLTYIQ